MQALIEPPCAFATLTTPSSTLTALPHPKRPLVLADKAAAAAQPLEGTSDLLAATAARSLSRSASRTSSVAGSATGQRTLASLAATAKRSARAPASDNQGSRDQAHAGGKDGWSAKPPELQAAHIEQLLRIFYLLSKAALGHQEEHIHYLLAAHYYATRLAATALSAAAAGAAAAGNNTGAGWENEFKPYLTLVPGTLQWCCGCNVEVSDP